MKNTDTFDGRLRALRQAYTVDLMMNEKGTFNPSEIYVERVKEGFEENGFSIGVERIDTYLEHNEGDYAGAIEQGRKYAEEKAEELCVKLTPLIG